MLHWVLIAMSAVLIIATLKTRLPNREEFADRLCAIRALVLQHPDKSQSFHPPDTRLLASHLQYKDGIGWRGQAVDWCCLFVILLLYVLVAIGLHTGSSRFVHGKNIVDPSFQHDLLSLPVALVALTTLIVFLVKHYSINAIEAAYRSGYETGFRDGTSGRPIEYAHPQSLRSEDGNLEPKKSGGQ